MAQDTEVTAICVLIPVTVRDRLDALAKSEERSLSWCVRKAIEAWLQSQQKPKE